MKSKSISYCTYNTAIKNSEIYLTRVIGAFHLTRPVFFMLDPELIKNITIKDFDHFHDHEKVFDEKDDPLLGNILTMMNGSKWKEMRNVLSPAFTGSKLRNSLELVNDCSVQLVQHFSQLYERGEPIILDVKDIFSRYTTDVIATCSFGVHVNSLTSPENEFYTMATSILMNLRRFASLIKLALLRIMPGVARKWNLRLLDNSIASFFKSLILDTMSIREDKNIVRPDMINLLMQVKKMPSSTTWSNDELVAQCLMFFIAGFETSSTLLSFLVLELALNEPVQTKLCHEVKEMSSKLTDKSISYELLQSMKYLDMVVSEALRKWPPALLMDRLCTKEYSLEFDEKKITIKEGHLVWIPIYGLHMNPKYFPNPSLFDPERFSGENIAQMTPGTYFPFGAGPRSCLGSRFAIMQIKSILFHLLNEFTFKICEKTKLPPRMGMLKGKGIHLELRKLE